MRKKIKLGKLFINKGTFLLLKNNNTLRQILRF